MVSVFIRTSPFNPDKPRYSNSITLNFEVPTNSTQEIIKYALQGLKMIYRVGFDYKKAGVTVTGIVADTHQQTSLFDTTDRAKLDTISKLMDKLNSKHGRNAITFAVQGTGSNWQPNAKNLSPKYTTHWGDLPKIEVD